MNNKTTQELETQLQELITRFCYRNGRHGETYLLEKGLQNGLMRGLLVFIAKHEAELIGEDEELERFHNLDEDFEAKAYDNGHRSERNNLRAEQRAKLTALTEKESKE